MRFYKIVIILILLFFICKQLYLAYMRQQYKAEYIYKGDLGVDIISYSQKWSNQDKLKSVYDELISNIYGEEINYLKAIYLIPDSPNNVAGFYYDNNFMNSSINISNNKAHIEIYNVNKFDDVSQFARILSHEYGHHFNIIC